MYKKNYYILKSVVIVAVILAGICLGQNLWADDLIYIPQETEPFELFVAQETTSGGNHNVDTFYRGSNAISPILTDPDDPYSFPADYIDPYTEPEYLYSFIHDTSPSYVGPAEATRSTTDVNLASTEGEVTE
jgi:hypothetical protein